MNKSKTHRTQNRNSRTPASNLEAQGVSQESFFCCPETTVAVTFHEDFGILFAAGAFQNEDGSWGFPADAELPIAAIEYLPGSYLAFVRGVPVDNLDVIHDECGNGNSWRALSRLGKSFVEADECFREVASSSSCSLQTADRIGGGQNRIGGGQSDRRGSKFS